MDTFTYTKRKRGGYYALTSKGMVIVERRYEFHQPTRDWVARFRGQTVISDTRQSAVETIISTVGE